MVAYSLPNSFDGLVSGLDQLAGALAARAAPAPIDDLLVPAGGLAQAVGDLAGAVGGRLQATEAVGELVGPGASWFCRPSASCVGAAGELLGTGRELVGAVDRVGHLRRDLVETVRELAGAGVELRDTIARGRDAVGQVTRTGVGCAARRRAVPSPPTAVDEAADKLRKTGDQTAEPVDPMRRSGCRADCWCRRLARRWRASRRTCTSHPDPDRHKSGQPVVLQGDQGADAGVRLGVEAVRARPERGERCLLGLARRNVPTARIIGRQCRRHR